LIFLDTNVVSEFAKPKPSTTVFEWVERHDSELALSSVVIGEIGYGIEQIRPAERPPRLQEAFASLRQRFAGRTYAFDEEASLIYGRVMGNAKRQGRAMSIPDGNIAAIALQHTAALATRNSDHFAIAELQLIDPWRRPW
jgi:predicted nucleic acid-binding protein